MATLNDLKALALALPPSERVATGEVGDVLSALIAVGQYGDDIITSAKEGKIADFFHQVATDKAEADGAEAPRRGSVPVEQPTTGQAAPAQDSALAQRVANIETGLERILHALEGQSTPAPTDPTVSTTTTDSTPSAEITQATDTVANPDAGGTAS